MNDENPIIKLAATIELQISKFDDEINKARMEKNIDLYLRLIQQKTELADPLEVISRSIYLTVNSAANQSDEAIRDTTDVEPNQYLIQIAGLLFSDDVREYALGCLEERFHNIYAESGDKIKAQWYLLYDVIESVFSVLKELFSNQLETTLIKVFVKVVILLIKIVLGIVAFYFLLLPIITSLLLAKSAIEAIA